MNRHKMIGIYHQENIFTLNPRVKNILKFKIIQHQCGLRQIQ